MSVTKRDLFNFISLLINLIVAILGTIAILSQIVSASTSPGVALGGFNAFRFFTNDGTIFCIITALIMVYFNLRYIITKTYKLPKIVYQLKLASAVTGLIIFLVVITILGPSMGYKMLLSGFYMIVVHILIPMFCLLGYIIFGAYPMKKKELSFGILPVAIYGIIALILVLTKVWVDNDIPYPFLRVYANSVWATIFYFIAILGGGYGLSIILFWSNQKLGKKFNFLLHK